MTPRLPFSSRSQRVLQLVGRSPLTVTHVFFITTALLFTLGSCKHCSIPDTWNGNWFITEFASSHPIIINSTSGTIAPGIIPDEGWGLGDCIWNEGDLFIFHDPAENCEKCVLITEKHQNVLYSKEAWTCLSKERREWDPESPIDTLCSSINDPDLTQHFWFRSDYKSIECPFGDKSFHFSYSKKSGTSNQKCENPISRSYSCVDETRVELHFEACHDQQNSVAKDQRMGCVGEWTDSGYRYLVADVTPLNNRGGHRPLEERFRCYALSEKKVPNTIPLKPDISIGFDIGTVESASCTGLHNPEDAETTLYFRNDKSENENRCSYPAWLASHSWIDMLNTVKFEMKPQSKNTTIHILPKLHSHSAPDLIPHNYQRYHEQVTFFPLSHSTLVCLEKRNVTSAPGLQNNSHIAVIGKYTVGCKTSEICLHIVQRSTHAFQMHYIEQGDITQEALRILCFHASTSSLRKGVTMISSREEMRTCSHPQNYETIISGNLESASMLQSFKHVFSPDSAWSVGCDDPHFVNVLPSPNAIDTEKFLCLDEWRDDNFTYTVLASESIHRGTFFCMIRNVSHAKTSRSDDSTNSIIVAREDCIHVSNTTAQNHATEDSIINEDLKKPYFIELLGTGSCIVTAKNASENDISVVRGGDSSDHENPQAKIDGANKSSKTIASTVPAYLVISILVGWFFSLDILV